MPPPPYMPPPPPPPECEFIVALVMTVCSSWMALATASGSPVTLSVRVGGLEPGSAIEGTCTRAPLRSWMPRIIVPCFPITAPASSFRIVNGCT